MACEETDDTACGLAEMTETNQKIITGRTKLKNKALVNL